MFEKRKRGESMNPSEVMTKAEERLLAKEIVNMILQKGVSYKQAAGILKEAKKEIGKVRITE